MSDPYPSSSDKGIIMFAPPTEEQRRIVKQRMRVWNRHDDFWNRRTLFPELEMAEPLLNAFDFGEVTIWLTSLNG